MSSLGEISVTIRAVNEATPAFEAIGSDAASMASAISTSSTVAAESLNQITLNLRTLASGIRTTAMMGSEIITLASNFGMVDRESAKFLRTITTMIMLVGTAVRLYNFLNVATTGHTAAITLNTTAQTANAASSLAVAAAHKIKAAATWLAVHAQNALNISHATFLALTGVGIGVIIAAAAAMAMFAAQMNAATASVEKYNAAVSETPTRTRGIVRAGEEELYRRGVER